MITYIFKGLDPKNNQFKIDISGNTLTEAITEFNDMYPNYLYTQIKEI